ncbi:MAG: OmpA family protein [Actinomycetota bacterium]
MTRPLTLTLAALVFALVACSPAERPEAGSPSPGAFTETPREPASGGRGPDLGPSAPIEPFTVPTDPPLGDFDVEPGPRLGPFVLNDGEIELKEVPEPERRAAPDRANPQDPAKPEPRPPTSPETGAEEVEAAPCRTFLLTGPTFASNEADLTGAAQGLLDELVEEIRTTSCSAERTRTACPTARLQVEVRGHTDDVATLRPGGNQQLSLDRARSVAGHLAGAGIRIADVQGFADLRPAPAPHPDTRSVAQRRQENRRTDIVLICASG